MKKLVFVALLGMFSFVSAMPSGPPGLTQTYNDLAIMKKLNVDMLATNFSGVLTPQVKIDIPVLYTAKKVNTSIVKHPITIILPKVKSKPAYNSQMERPGWLISRC